MTPAQAGLQLAAQYGVIPVVRAAHDKGAYRTGLPLDRVLFAASRAIAGTSVPDADAMMIIARRTRTDPCLPRRTICCSRCPS